MLSSQVKGEEPRVARASLCAERSCWVSDAVVVTNADESAGKGEMWE